MITAIVPVKAQSERLPNKNLQPFMDTTLYEHKLRQLQDVSFDKVVVSSESVQVLDIAAGYGFDIHFRDAMYSTADVPMAKVYSYMASQVDGEDIAWVNVNNPLVGADHYEEAIKDYYWKKNQNDCLLSTYNLQKYVWWENFPVNWKPYSSQPHPKSQDLQGLLAMSFAINILPRESLIKWGTCVGHKPYFYIMDAITSTKIDYKEDLDYCEMIWRQRHALSNHGR